MSKYNRNGDYNKSLSYSYVNNIKQFNDRYVNSNYNNCTTGCSNGGCCTYIRNHTNMPSSATFNGFPRPYCCKNLIKRYNFAVSFPNRSYWWECR